MKKRLTIYLSFIWLLGFLFSCQKEEIKVEMPANPVPPAITTLPNLNLQRSNASDTLVFVGTPVNPGFRLCKLFSGS